MQRPTVLNVLNDRTKQTIPSKTPMAHSYTDTDESKTLVFASITITTIHFKPFFQYHNSFQKWNTITSTYGWHTNTLTLIPQLILHKFIHLINPP
jgi:hypothetical protein